MNALRHDGAALDAAIRLDSLPPEGRRLAVEATPAQREALAERLRVLSVDRLTAELEAERFRGGVRITGRLQAAVTQACVVTFEPVAEKIDEPLERIFLPGSRGSEAAAPGHEVFVDLEAEDEPDRFEGHEVDISEYLVETLALALDPYPRAPDAELPPEVTGPDDEATSAFAALAQWKSTRD